MQYIPCHTLTSNATSLNCSPCYYSVIRQAIRFHFSCTLPTVNEGIKQSMKCKIHRITEANSRELMTAYSELHYFPS